MNEVVMDGVTMDKQMNCERDSERDSERETHELP
jgi:hypothetical protein